MPYLFDTNTFLRLAEKNDPQRQLVIDAIRSLRSSNESLFYTPQILAEFWNVCTRPTTARGGLGLLVSQTKSKADLIAKYFTILHDGPATFNEWRRLVSDFQVKGVQVHDARLVASMMAYSIPHLITFNTADFSRFTAVTAIHPGDI